MIKDNMVYFGTGTVSSFRGVTTEGDEVLIFSSCESYKPYSEYGDKIFLVFETPESLETLGKFFDEYRVSAKRNLVRKFELRHMWE